MRSKQMEAMAREHDMTAINAEVAEAVAEAVAESTVSGYKKIEDGVARGYKKLETGIVDGFGKVVDKCVEVLFAKEGESVEDAKARLSGKDKE